MRTSRRRRLLLPSAVVIVLALASCSTAGQPTPVEQLTVPASTAPTSASPTIPLSSAPPATTQPVPTQPGTTQPVTTQPVQGLGSVGLAGVNNPSCTSDERPVVLLHGTFSTVKSNFAAMTSGLQASGRCVYGLDYGLGGLQSVRTSAASISGFVDEVLQVTGAEQVDVVAFSQGGLALRTALRWEGLASKVAVAVLIAPSFHGTTSTLLNALPAGACPACSDQGAGSALLTELDAGGDLDGDVRYAVVSSENDTIVTPIGAQRPDGPADRVRSIVVQDQCPGEVVDHIALPAEPGVIAWAVDALDTDGAPDPAALTCR